MPTLEETARTVAEEHFRWIGGGSQAISTCHVDNVVEALVLAADGGRPGQSYFIRDGQDSTLRPVISALLSTRGIAPADRAVPFPLAWSMAGLMEFFWRNLRIEGEPPLTKQMLRLIGKDFTVNDDKSARELGYRPIVDWDDGLSEMREESEFDHPHP